VKKTIRLTYIYLLGLVLIMASCIQSDVNVELRDVPDSIDVTDSADSFIFFAETAPDGTGNKLSNTNLWTRSSDLFFYAIERDGSGNFITNTTVQWSLEGSAGTLTVQGGGKSASFKPSSTGNATVTYTVEGVSKSIDITVNHNSAPTLNMTTPNVGVNTVLETEVFNILWTDSDVDDDAQIQFYYSSLSSGQCDLNSPIGIAISEDDGVDSFAWDTTGVPVGVYYICATITDLVGGVDVWNPQALTITDNLPPTFSFTNPTASTIVPAATGINMTWTDDDPDEDATIKIYYKNSSSGACSTGVLLTSTTEDSNVDSYSWDTSTVSSGKYYLCASLDDGFNPVVDIHSSMVSVSRDCNWLGLTNSFEQSTNWSSCNSLTPQATDFLVITATANDPVLSSNVSIYGIAAGGTNQDFTISSGSKLTIDTTINFKSSITFKGDSSTCSNCEIGLLSTNTFVVNDSTLRIESGMTIRSATSSIDLGDGATSGHLEIAGGAGPGEKVQVLSDAPWGFRGFVFNGTSSIKSSAYILNANIDFYHGSNSNTVFGIHFKDNYEVKGLDYISFGNLNYLATHSESITFENCGNGVFTDTDFSNLEYTSHFTWDSSNIKMDATTCTSLPSGAIITMTGASGWGYGSVFEVDPNNLVTWYDEIAGTCVWTGGANSDDWFEPNNWSGCTNGRGNYPDQFNYVDIPSGLSFEPVVDENIVIQGFTTTGGPSGGKLTINSGSRLWLTAGEISTDVVISGFPDNCTDCILAYEKGSILNNATLTLENGLRLRSKSGQSIFNVGDGVTPGHLIINSTSSDKTHWVRSLPHVYYNGGIKVHGQDLANKSSVSVNGYYSQSHHLDPSFEFIDFYEIKKFDNFVTTSAFNWDNLSTRILIQNCDNAVFTDKSWDEIDFYSPAENPFTDEYNIEFMNCTGSLNVGPIDITKMTGGSNASFGMEYSSDPENFLIWNP
jgi:hypothetical protein